MEKKLKIVCLGGGIGTVNLITGLRAYTPNITAVISLADDGGSTGRLRRLYNTYPLGDVVSCLAAMSGKENKFLKELLLHRFPGNRYAKDTYLEGHKLGNLILLSLVQLTNNLDEAIVQFQKLFDISGTFLPATKDIISLSAITIDGKKISGEEKIDLGKYQGKKILEKISIHPQDAQAHPLVIQSIQQADAIIFGPGDLYTNLLPVMVVPQIAQALKNTQVKKIFVVNIANKPVETRHYTVADFVNAVEKHIGTFPFDYLVVNNNFSIPIPRKYHYTYVRYKKETLRKEIHLIEGNLVNEAFPLYHDANKLAKVILKHI